MNRLKENMQSPIVTYTHTHTYFVEREKKIEHLKYKTICKSIENKRKKKKRRNVVARLMCVCVCVVTAVYYFGVVLLRGYRHIK